MLVLNLLPLVVAAALLGVAVLLDGRTLKTPCKEQSESLQIFDFLASGEEVGSDHPLLRLRPRGRARRRVAEVLATLSHNFVECRPERVRMLSCAWGVESGLLRRMERGSSRVAVAAMEQLLRLHPSQRATLEVEKMEFRTPSTRLLQLLLNTYAKPSQVTFWLKHHPHKLSWGEVGRVVEVLKMRSPILEPPKCESSPTHNTELLLLYMAQVEGVGDVEEVAQRLSQGPDEELRVVATNTLWSTLLFPRYDTFHRGY